MKLIYQWIIVLVLSGILWALHIYGGSGCSKPLPTRPYIPPLKIVVQRRASVAVETDSSTPQDEVPKVQTTPPSKTASQKRRERRKKLKLKIPRDSQEDTEWDFCKELGTLKMVQ